MSSLGANIVRRIIKAATYSYRKNCYADPSYCLPKTLKTTKSSLEKSLRIADTRRLATNTSRLHMPQRCLERNK